MADPNASSSFIGHLHVRVKSGLLVCASSVISCLVAGFSTWQRVKCFVSCQDSQPRGVKYRVQQVRVAVVLASRRCPATGRKGPGRLDRVGLGGRLQCTSEYPPASPTVCAWQVSSMSFFIGSVLHFSSTSFARMVRPWNSAQGCSPRHTGMV